MEKKQDYLTITEVRKDVKATRSNPPFEKVYPELYINRWAEFSDDGKLNWSSFEPIKSLTELAKQIKDIKGDAPGTVKMWAGLPSAIPLDYKLCDGSELQITEFKELYDMVGVSFGGDGQKTFNLPDLRGRFIVGCDNTNPDYDAINKDKKGGYKEVSLEKEHLPEHNHTNSLYFNKLLARASDVDFTNTPESVDGEQADKEYRVAGMSDPQWKEATIKSVGENKPHENRTPYFTLAYIIKVI